MRESLLGQIRCPRCRAESGLELAPARCDAREVREGELRCAGCGAAYAIRNGVVDLLHAPPDFVVREAAGLARFAERMRADGWDRERILALPHEPSDYWFGQARAMEAVLASVAPRPGERVLDVGANTCWASNMLAEAGLEVRLTEPADHHFFRGEHYVLAPETPTVTTLKRTGVQLARRSRLGRRLYLAYRTLLAGGVSLNMVCTKPADG